MAKKLISCKTCGHEIAKSAKKCPNCGKKRPLLQRNPVGAVLLIVICLFVVLGIIGSSGNSDKPALVENTASSDQLSQTTPSVSPEAKTEFYIGETAEIRDIQATLTRVTQGNGSSYMRPDDGYVFLICEFEVVNNSSSELSISSIMCVDAYCDDYSISLDLTALTSTDVNTLDGTVAPGKKLKGAVGYQVPDDWNQIELIFTPDYWSGKEIKFICSNTDI